MVVTTEFYGSNVCSISVEKACPIVLRQTSLQTEILAFQHPLAKRQLVKGTIDPGEKPGEAACRELREESGLIADSNPLSIGNNEKLLDGNTWHYFLCTVKTTMPDHWEFETLDDGGHRFEFFWHSLGSELDATWHPLFHDVFLDLRPKLNELGVSVKKEPISV